MEVVLGIDPASTRIAYVALAEDDSYLAGANKKLG